MKKRTIIAAAGILVSALILIVITGGIDSIRFPAGITIPSSEPTPPTEPEPFDLGGRPSPGFGFDMISVFLPISLIFILAGTIASIRSKRFRYELGISLFAFTALVVFYSLAGMIHGSRPLQPITDAGGLAVASGTEAQPAEGGPLPSEPNPEENGWGGWRIRLAIGLAVLVLLLSGAFLTGRRRVRVTSLDPPPGGLGEIAEWAGEAAARIRAGEDIASVVERCYARMSEILSRQSDIDPTYMTPREFAASLSRVGMADEHVKRLTGMFELVRYGSRPDGRFAERAVASLEAIKREYATAQ